MDINVVDEDDFTDEELEEILRFHNQVDTDANWASLSNIDSDANIPSFGQFSHMILDTCGFDKESIQKEASSIARELMNDEEEGLARFGAANLWKLKKKNGKLFFVRDLKDGEVHKE